MAQDFDEFGCSNNYSLLVFETKNGEKLFERRSDEKIYPASLTKLMTIYLVFEKIKAGKLSMSQILTISDRAEYNSGINKINSLKLKVGDQILVREAIRGSIVKSFNETTIALAEEVAGGEWQFVKMMNKKAQELGMLHTNFRNASGLFDFGQYTTDYDLARLAMALKNDFPEYYHFFALKDFTYKGVKYPSHNNVLLEYKGVEGMKTGYTMMSGYNLITVAKKNNRRVMSILTSCASYQKRDFMTKKLLDDAFVKIFNKNDELQIKFDKKLYHDKNSESEN